MDIYALEVKDPSSLASEVIWKKYNPNSNNQLWYAESATPVDLPDGVYKIQNKKSGLMLDVTESNGTILQHGFNGGKNQQWRVTKINNDGSYKLQTLSTVRPGYLNRNDNVSVIKSNCMVVKLYETSEGRIRVHMPGSCWCMQVQGGSMNNYTPVIWSAANATGNDQWKFDPVK